MSFRDPITNQAYPPETIQRITHITAKVHVYRIPPLNNNKGYTAATWTDNPPIFTARLRVVETSIPPSVSGQVEKVATHVLLEDGGTGELFAAAPYDHPTAVQQALDSSRFFAVRVVGERGMKATLGIGFEDRSEAFDFGVALQDAQKSSNKATGGVEKSKEELKAAPQHDYSLKEGEMIHVKIGSRTKRNAAPSSGTASDGVANNRSPGVIGGGGATFLPPPPSAQSVRRESGKGSSESGQQVSAKDLGFDDGEFGEFQ